MTLTLRHDQALAMALHQLRLLRNYVRDEAPPLYEADAMIEDAMAGFDEVESALNGARLAVLAELRKRDDIESGDRDPDGEPRPWPRPTP